MLGGFNIQEKFKDILSNFNQKLFIFRQAGWFDCFFGAKLCAQRIINTLIRNRRLKTSSSFFLLTLIFLVIWSFTTGFGQAVSFPKPEIISAEQGLPQGFVPGIVQDSQGLIWIATRNGLCKYDGKHVKVFENKNTSPLSSLGLEEMSIGPDKKIWILSDQGEADIFDPVSETIVNYSSQPFFKRAFQKRNIKRVFPDKQNRLWFLLEKDGLAMVDRKTNKVRFYDDRPNNSDSLNTVKALHITQLRDGSIWLATVNGIFTVDAKTGNLTRYRSSHPDFRQIQNSCYAMTERPNGNLLLLAKSGIATLNRMSGNISYQPLPADEKFEHNHPIVADSKGNSYFFRLNSLYRFSESSGLNEFPQAGSVSEFKSIYIDCSEVLWAGTNGQGVRKYNLRATYFNTALYQTSFTHDVLRSVTNAPGSNFADLPSDLFVYNFRYTFDHDQNMWFSGGRTPLYKFNLITKRIEAVPFPVVIPANLSSDRAISLSTDPDGRVWALHDSILIYREGDRWLRFKYAIRSALESGIMQLVADRQALWIATSAKGLYRVDRSTGRITQFAHRKGDPKTINSDNIYCLFGDPDEPGLLWIGTFGGGLARFDKRTGFVKNITSKNGLPNDVVYSAIPDRHGNIWAATNQGLAQINKKTFQIRVYTREDGLLADEFNRFHSLQLPDDRILLGGIEGVTSFNPAISNVDQYQPPVLITTIAVNNVAIEPGKHTHQLPIRAIKSLELDYQENFITVEFAAMQFNRSDKIRYRYQLDGLEDRWIETENPVTKYTDLRPGQYTLKLNASNTQGVWSKHITTLNITIHPPWWQTWWAYLLYCMAALLLSSAILSFYAKRLKMRQSMIVKQKELELIDKEAKQLRDLDEMKTRFFSNITHEFRTPLTLILAPTEQMMGETRNPEDVNRLGLIDRNAHQLLGLVNQLLDLSKLDSGTIRITESRGDLRAFVERLTESFHPSALAKDVVLKSEYFDLKTTYYFDYEKLERILNNLLSNALKFTPEGGLILVTLRGLEKYVELSVYDNGTGISQDQLDKVFERFYQINNTDTNHAGSGIGLAIVKELVEVQKGTIRVVSAGLGTGTEFIIRLPYRAGDLNEDAPITPPTTQNDDQAKQVFDQTASREKILLVEDHPDLGEFIEESLGKKYECLRAGNGAEALLLMAEKMHDLVISDVMMPVMDGYSLCKKIKEDLQTSHIPVLLLTAKNGQTSRMEGLLAGADDYITKPFHMPELQLRVQNIFIRQRRLRETLHAQLTGQGKLQENIGEDVSDPFFAQLYTILNEQLDNPSFGVTELTQAIGMSNSSLNRKLKALSGISAVELIRNYRLKKAAGYLAEGKNISEAAYLVGFDNLSYFAKCFRDLFQMSPRDFATKARRP